MPVLLKNVKKALEADIAKVGKTPDGSYKHTPPSIVGRKISKYPKLGVSKFETRPRPGIKSLSYTGLVKSESTGIRYKVTIQFHNLVYKDIESKQFFNKAKIGKVVKYYRTPSVQRNPVTMKCQCQDFRHRFETPLSKAGGLIGGPRKYTRKTSPWPVGRPSANATDKLGMCKHLSSLLFHLRDKGLIKER